MRTGIDWEWGGGSELSISPSSIFYLLFPLALSSPTSTRESISILE